MAMNPLFETYAAYYRIRLIWAIAWRYAAFGLGVWALLWITGCTMTKYGVTQEQANQDAYECRRESRTITNGSPIDAYRDCMHARGYT